MPPAPVTFLMQSKLSALHCKSKFCLRKHKVRCGLHESRQFLEQLVVAVFHSSKTLVSAHQAGNACAHRGPRQAHAASRQVPIAALRAINLMQSPFCLTRQGTSVSCSSTPLTFFRKHVLSQAHHCNILQSLPTAHLACLVHLCSVKTTLAACWQRPSLLESWPAGAQSSPHSLGPLGLPAG